MEALKIIFVVLAIFSIIFELFRPVFDDEHKISIPNVLGWMSAIIWCII